MIRVKALKKAHGLLGLAAILLLAVLLLALFLRVELTITGDQLGVPLDDAWIHFQFARNLSQGEGFSFNPGQPTPGSTAPLWTVLLAGFGLFSHDFVPAALVLSALFFLLTIALSYSLTLTLSGKRAVGLIAALGVTLSGRLLWAGLAGMETTAFAALSVAALWAYSRRGLRPAAAILFALAGQMRPEGHALFALAVIDTLWSIWQERRAGTGEASSANRDLGRLAIAGVIYVLLSLPYSIFSLSQTGRPLPNTFYAKVSTSQIFSMRTLREITALHWRDNPAAFLLLIPGIIQTWRRSRLVVAWLVLLPLFTGFTVDFVWHHGRYTLPLIPVAMVVAAQGAEWLAAKAPSKIRTYAASLIVLIVVVSGSWQLPAWARQLGHNSREILLMDVAIGNWLAENTSPDELIAVDDIGAIGYLSGRPIVDLNGLISPMMWPILHDEPQGHLRSEATTRLLSGIQPDYLAIFPVWHWEIANNPYVARPVERFHVDSRTIIGEQEAIVYRAQWPYLQGTSTPEEPLANFGDRIELLDFDLLPPDSSRPLLEVALFWHSLAPVEKGYDVFIHVLGSDGAIVAQADGQPVHNLAPTRRWQPGDIIEDTHLIEWPQELPGGTYRVQAGLYLRDTGQRLPADAAGASGDAVLLNSIEWPDDAE